MATLLGLILFIGVIALVLWHDTPLWQKQKWRTDALKAKMLGTEPCRRCGVRAKYRWLHETMSGTPDMRYRANPVICSACFKAKDS